MDNESKLYVKKMLLSGDAVVTQFKGGGGSGTVSDVWKRFGRIAMRDSGDLVQGVVACGLCYKVYSYKNSSQGTSTLRLHVCEYDDAPPQQRKGSRKNSTAAGRSLSFWSF
jgi:BED zinc finger